MQKAFDYCDVLNVTKTTIVPPNRVDERLFDMEAFREAWFNACLHNLWIEKVPPAVYVFSDRIEIVSNGGIPNNLTEEDFFNGVSKPVNDE